MSENWQLVSIDTANISGSGYNKVRNILNGLVEQLKSIGFTEKPNAAGFLSSTGSANTTQITYYNVLISPNGAKLWIAYTGTGCQLHYTTFAYTSIGSLDGSNNPVYPKYPVVSGGGNVDCNGWRGGILTAWIPAGSSSDFGIPNNTDDTWLPPDATRICGHLANTDVANNTTNVFCSAAISGPALIYLLYKDDCLQVYNWGKFKGRTNYWIPYLTGYINGKIFESVAEDDTSLQSKFGWIELSHATRDEVQPNSYGYYYGLWNYPSTTLDSGYYVQPTFFYRSIATTKMSPSTTGVNDRTGGMGFFKKDGTIHNRNAGDECFYCAPMHGVNNLVYNGVVAPTSDYPLDSVWYPLEVGILYYNYGDLYETKWKGILRTDLIRCYGVISSVNYQYRWGTLLDDGNMVMGPCNCAFGFSKYIDLKDSPWHIKPAFTLSGTSLAPTGTKLPLAVTSQNNKVYVLYADTSSDMETVNGLEIGICDGTSYYEETVVSEAAIGQIANYNNNPITAVRTDSAKQQLHIYEYDSNNSQYTDVGYIISTYNITKFSICSDKFIANPSIAHIFSTTEEDPTIRHDAYSGSFPTTVSYITNSKVVSNLFSCSNDRYNTSLVYLAGNFDDGEGFFYNSYTDTFYSINATIKGLELGADQCLYVFCRQASPTVCYVMKFSRFGKLLWVKPFGRGLTITDFSVTQNITEGSFHLAVQTTDGNNYDDYYYMMDYNAVLTEIYTDGTGLVAKQLEYCFNDGTNGSYTYLITSTIDLTIPSLTPSIKILSRSW